MAILQLPPPPSGGLGNVFARLNQALIQAFQSLVSINEPAPRVILVSPNGTHYAVTVDDAGTLVTTAV